MEPASQAATPLRRSLFLRFALLVTGALALFALGYMQFGLRPVVDRIADSHFSAAAEKVGASLDRLFDPVEIWVGVARQWAMSMPPDENKPDEFNRIFQPLLKQSPHFTSVVAGTSDGRGWLLLEKPDGTWMNRFTNIAKRGHEQRFIDWDANGNKTVRNEIKDYDPRTRPWYQGAATIPADGTVFWTDPYIFFTTGEPGISASTSVNMPDGEMLALGIDIKLLDISRASSSVTVGESGYATVMTPDGLLLGLPRSTKKLDSNRIQAMALKPAAILGNPVITEGLALWQREGRPNGSVLRYTADGVTWLASFRDFRRGKQVFWVSVFAPETDFIPPWQPMAQGLLAIFAAVLALSFLLALRYTRCFSVPLESLATASARIAKLDFQDGSIIQSNIAEIRQLASAQEKMRSMLSTYQRTVDEQAASLKHQIVALQNAESRLEHLSQHDPLTSLPNRLLLNDRLAKAVQRAERHGRQLAVLFLDLDRFKAVNDSQGHPVGDQLLRIVAKRLATMLRKTDTLARLGGDEFVLLAEDIQSKDDVANLANKLLNTLITPFELEGRAFHLTGSVGISLYPTDGTDPVALIRNADSAMYQAKSQGRNSFHFYSEDMTSRAIARHHLEEALHLAIKRNEFELHYQPQVNLQNRQLVGVEALVRWQPPGQGLVPPDQFIPLAEEAGLIGKIGEWVLEESCRQWAEWNRQGMIVPRMAINLSVKQLQGNTLSALVKRVLDQSGMPAGILELEMTESFLLESSETLNMLTDIARTGVSFALDDFGTGYSSLGYLKKLPLARLKIDRGFTWDIGKNTDGEAVVRAIIGLAGALGREVIAEGVETREQADFMLAHGCRQAQGYYYSKPLTAADFIDWWGRQNTASAQTDQT
ncbi:MAG TPA: EAL domain-containing protein [Thiobacillus sp.]